MRNYIPILIAVTGLLSTCNPPKHKDPVPLASRRNDVIVLNEGGFQYNNAEISVYNADSGTVTNDVFWLKNNKSMGDVLQSVAVHDNKYYWVLNNSGKIVITDSNYVETGLISNLKSPRHIYFATTQKMYVSDLYANKIAVVDIASRAVISYIALKGWTEKFIKDPYTNHVWVSNRYRNQIYKINTSTDALEDSITTGYSSCDLVYDKDGHLWVSCSGKSEDKLPSSLLCIDIATKQIIRELKAPPGNYFGDARLSINVAGDNLYWLDDGLKKASIYAQEYPSNYFIEPAGTLFYGMSIHPGSNDIYVTDAVDYSQNGYLLRYDSLGQLIAKVKVGKIPNGVFFK